MTSDTPPTEPNAAPPPPPPPPPPSPPVRRLTRPRDDRLLGGVSSGIARYFAIDPVIVRVAAVALALFGGAGILLYLAALLLVPSEGEAGAEPADRSRWLVVLGVIVLVCLAAPLVFGPSLLFGGLLFPVAFLTVAGLVTAWFVTGRWPEREAGPIARATALGLGVLAVLSLVAFGAAWAAAAGGGEVVAGLVIAAGAGLVAGAFLRPVRWLVPLALALALPAGFVQAAGIELDGGVGEKSYRPYAAADVRGEYELGVGEMVVDLRDVEFPGGDREIDIDLGVGQATVIVPDAVCVVTRAQVGMGEINRFGRRNGGIDIDVEDVASAPRTVPRLILDGDVGLGELRLRRASRQADIELRRDRPAGWRDRVGGSGPLNPCLPAA